MPERRRKYTPEFKTEAAKMVVESVSRDAVMRVRVAALVD